MDVDWGNIHYLKNGTERQRCAYSCLIKHQIVTALEPYNPVLVGTIPLQIDVKNSDLDMICEVYAHNQELFISDVTQKFSQYPSFKLEVGDLAITCNFDTDDFPIEIYAEARPVTEQNGYRHMVAEARILRVLGEVAVAEIRQLKEAGMKTEPAFAAYLQLPGDPYEAMLEWYDRCEEELVRSLAHFQCLKELSTHDIRE
ncbi:DUF4269 domain-containing protein [Paenibacillus sp. 481]|uniref:DUF4269 domain-containing protein n=1 Tax=Paenibacillus sp. 481 TaxID=2835869 RepID=UPI001E518609|nr:DUF4269 domain-containing protein [Paenibacillus sp. 481]UHA72793.1 DUF4269 domain-containing protein [Paenibacillus sp. 481]